ncbi:hypothetical protein EXIGLDRAFT_766343 [Exidia glandulosa HHB12029]|uniref:Uncharacterized protein n=1 Tax=Exidia glandulosa HHB12029 TaxID=1314781 RepID=A0A165JU10_EXIGL|nr:hypothetical protein EXIGLDRAFT_766343 [Exidia glandulosa HHB12029]
MADGGIEIDIESPAAVGCELALVDGRVDTLVAGFDALAAEFDALADGGGIETKIECATPEPYVEPAEHES